MTSLGYSIMNHYSLQFVLIKLLIYIMVIVDAISGKWINIEFLRERTISVEFKLLHSFIIEFESFKCDYENLR